MRIFKIIVLVSYFLFIFSFSFTTSLDLNQDLGRHLKLGEIISKTKQVPRTNLFSYTNPSFEFINHHWLSEVIFYQLKTHFGLNSLTYLKTALIILSLAFVVKFSIDRAGFIPTILTALLFTPIIIERADIRPELFGYLLFSILLCIVLSFKKHSRLIYFVPLIMLLWINLHISFVFGVILLLILLLKVFNRQHLLSPEFVCVFFGFAVLFLNPSGLKGMIYPFTIFQNYGYSIVENQNLFFLSRVISNPLIKYFFLLTPLVIIPLLVLITKRRFVQVILLFLFFLLAVWQIRHFPFFVLVEIPTVAMAINNIVGNGLKSFPAWVKYASIVSIIGINIFLSALFFSNRYYRTFDINKSFGAGFVEDAKPAAEFLLKNNSTINIFNNFDIGGYLIYKLYPGYKLFVDNRPEAYPKEFFKKVYVQLQENPELRNKIFEKYKINTVFFAYADQTPWAHQFIQTILADNQWKLIYVDSTVIILSRQTVLSDLKINQKYFQTLIDHENNYLSLLRLAQFFNDIKKPDLLEKAFNKAQKINPSSCSINKYIFLKQQNLPQFFGGDDIKNNNWWCF